MQHRTSLHCQARTSPPPSILHFSWQDYSGSTSPSSSESNARTGVSLRRQLTERCNTVHHCTVKPAHLPHHQSVHFSWQDYSGSTSPSSSESNARTGVSLRRQLTERCNTVHHCTVKPAHLPHHQSYTSAGKTIVEAHRRHRPSPTHALVSASDVNSLSGATPYITALSSPHISPTINPTLQLARL